MPDSDPAIEPYENPPPDRWAWMEHVIRFVAAAVCLAVVLGMFASAILRRG